jgi:uncharacterized membrane protein
MLSYVALFLIVLAVILVALGIYKLHGYPGKVAKARNHPQVAAIKALSIMGLLVFPFWMVALVWAYMKPVMKPIEAVGPGEEIRPARAPGEETE